MPRLTVLNVKGVGFGGDDHCKIDYRNNRFHDGYNDGNDDDFGDGSEYEDCSLGGDGDDAHGGDSDGGHDENDYGDHDDGRAWRLAYVQGNEIWRAIPPKLLKTSVAEKLVIEVDKVEDVEEMVMDIMDMASWWADGELSRCGRLRWEMTTMGHGFHWTCASGRTPRPMPCSGTRSRSPQIGLWGAFFSRVMMKKGQSTTANWGVICSRCSSCWSPLFSRIVDQITFK
ncbi:hypothetical protein AMAG_18851 [Allomyces macrogynus ATCC 38327]|uniref:Uncharacterized protein n=1 Tax=Allomyces macrogynus (strain ATCC 38327) TaxID=578462 RepID=A0A0L0SIY4_ALLM3|nr:hypothetical protein AMAG_18851 [Allomyces macrogynus ATCC 38327]|eukprot:KNE62330.1 hypothetical protein AMAG_18851 [Allomyces macrogynus ATCC 38327]